MVAWTLVISSLLILGVSLLYFIVGRAVLDPTATRPERQARSAFGLWWFCLAAFTARGAVNNLMAASGVHDTAIYASLQYIGLTFLFVGLAGLMYYLLYLYTGRSWVIYPISIFYGLFLLVGFYVTTLGGAAAIEAGRWNVELVSAHDPNPLLIGILQGVLIVPLIIAVLLYFLLYFMVDTAMQKQRILLVGGALLFWFGTAGIATAVNLTEADAWGFVRHLIALIAAGIILYAFTLLEKRHGPNPEPDAENSGTLDGPEVGSPHQKALPVFQAY